MAIRRMSLRFAAYRIVRRVRDRIIVPRNGSRERMLFLSVRDNCVDNLISALNVEYERDKVQKRMREKFPLYQFLF